ncbi:MAG: hypothetical protein EOP93_18210, partial [Lysobacteraceae bacterium]
MKTSSQFELLHAEGSATPIKGWVRGVPLEPQAHEQLRNIASIPFVGPWVAVMPDVHLGKGATVGSVIPTRGAIIPAAVGVDIGCGMAAVRTTLRASDLPDDLGPLRNSIERSVPICRSSLSVRILRCFCLIASSRATSPDSATRVAMLSGSFQCSPPRPLPTG